MNTQRKFLPYIIGFSIIVLAAYAAVVGSRSTVITDSTQPPAGTYTLVDVATHSTQSSCWTAVNGNVYDLTQWIAQHPGGESAILNMCGTDATDAFERQHGGQQNPEQQLATFKIGTLAK